MRTPLTFTVVVALGTIAPSIAHGQSFPFERTFPAAGPVKLDVSTHRGKIEIVAGDSDRIVVAGEATVRVGWDVPANAVELARQVAAAPPIERDGETTRLRPPTDTAAQRAVTVSYRVRVPPNAEVRTNSNSGATAVRGVTGSVDVRTQSAAVDLRNLGSAVTVSTGSGAVAVQGVAGPLDVTTNSSGFTATDIGGSLRARTQSGEIDVILTGTGAVDVETGSGAIRLRGLHGALIAKTQSGRLEVHGAPRAEWTATTASSSINVDVEAGGGFSIDASSRSGSVKVEGAQVNGSVTERAVKGDIHGGGPILRLSSRSGAVRVQVAFSSGGRT